MGERRVKPITEAMKASEVRQNFSSVINRVARENTRVIVEKSGAPVAVIVPAKDLRHLERLDAEDQEAWDVVESMREAFRDVPDEEIERETQRIFAEMREEGRSRRQALVTR